MFKYRRPIVIVIWRPIIENLPVCNVTMNTESNLRNFTMVCFKAYLIKIFSRLLFCICYNEYPAFFLIRSIFKINFYIFTLSHPKPQY